MTRLAIAAAALAALAGAPAIAGEITPEDRAAIIDALAAADCAPEEADDLDIEREDDVWEVEDVTCADGEEYEFKLDADFKVTEKEED